MQTLFPFLGLLSFIGVFLYFIKWKNEKKPEKEEVRYRKQPIRRHMPTAPPNEEPLDIEEGFRVRPRRKPAKGGPAKGSNCTVNADGNRRCSGGGASDGIVTQVALLAVLAGASQFIPRSPATAAQLAAIENVYIGTKIDGMPTPVYPSWSQPSITFATTEYDSYYEEYAIANLTPLPELAAQLKSIPADLTPLPNFGAQLGTFDSGMLTDIPWDADNTDYTPDDITWGIISRQASASIFLKVYTANLAADSENLVEADTSFQYHSPVLGITTNDPTTSAALQAADSAAAIVGQQLVDKALETSTDKASKAAAKQAKMAKRAAQQAARNAKVASGQALTAAEKLAQAAADVKAVKLKWFNKISKALNKLSVVTKFKAGLKLAQKLATKIATKFAAMLSKTASKIIIGQVFMKTISALIYSVYAVLIGFSCTPAAPAAAPLAIAWSIVVSLWTALDTMCTVLMLSLMVMLPALMGESMANGASCPNGGKPIDVLIPDPFLYFVFSTFLPIGGVMDAFGPYVCYYPDGSAIFKQPLYIPPYYSDATLSLYRHEYSREDTARGDSTSWTDPAESVPAGWTIVAGIARSPCDPGTWTSSDVDMLCNISTYVPPTYVKKSRVPATNVKRSRVPQTHVKRTQILTRAKSSSERGVYGVTTRGCHEFGNGLRDDGTACWDDLKSRSDPVYWDGRCNWGAGCFRGGDVHWSGCGCKRAEVWDRVQCRGNDHKDGLLCYPACPEGQYPSSPIDVRCYSSCNSPGYSNETDWGLFCTTSNCPDGANCVLGVAWYKCTSNQTDVGALCRDKCNSDEREVLGVCWSSCPPNTVDVGALCRDNCSGDTPHDVAGICWGSCGDDIDVGALCRKRCREGFHEVAGCCWGNTGTYARQSMLPKSHQKYDPGYNPPRKLEDVSFPWCNFADPIMLDRMAQFYYEQSILHPVTLDDGRQSFEFIVGFYGVIASSELSCDVACCIKTLKYDLVTGGKYEESVGTFYPEDPGNNVSYRRFYFIHNNDASSGRPVDPKGFFTVTACTNADYTAPDAQVKSGPDVEPVISVPKVFKIIDKEIQPGTFSLKDFNKALASAAIQQGIGAAPGAAAQRRGTSPSMQSQVAAGVAGGMAGEAASKAIDDAYAAKKDPNSSMTNTVIGDHVNGFYIATNNDKFSINHGPTYETRAANNSGYIPKIINFCDKILITSFVCSHQYILRDTIAEYHRQNPRQHVKSVDIIEPRGKDGCYYQWNTVSYDPDINTEGDVINGMEVVRQYVINDRSTCVFTPTDNFITNMANYPIRQYFDPVEQETIYPTREVKSTATVQGRYIRIRPSQIGGDGFLHISQIVVYDPTGKNIAINRPVYATSTYGGSDGVSAAANIIVDGNLVSRSGLGSVWTSRTADRQAEYIDVDLGMTYFIQNVMYIGRLDCCQDRNIGVRIQVLFNNNPMAEPVKELATTTNDVVQLVDFGTNVTVPKHPRSPFQVPRPIPAETNLGDGSCPSRCQDKTQIDSLVQQFNANSANTNAQILKVLKAVTPTSKRCDYEVEIIRTANGKKTVAKEIISMGTTLASSTPNTGIVYGRYVRVKSATGTLAISQVVVNSASGTNFALKRPVSATSNLVLSQTPSVSGVAALITDGTTSVRASPSYWAAATTGAEYIDIDLGQSQAISNIVFYGIAGGVYAGVQIQVLMTNETFAKPVFSSTLASGATPQTIRYNQCAFTYSPLSPVGTFIQDNTPQLSATDTSGGVLTFHSIGRTITSVFNDIIAPIKALDPLGVLNTNVKSADTAAKNTLNAAAANIQLQGCPNTKCSDPAVLKAIMNRYNADNSVVESPFSAETHTMSAILKAGVSGSNFCDVIFTDLYSLYNDYLYPAVNTETTTMAKRFVMNNTGNCTMQVMDGTNSILDISMNTVGLIAPSSALTTAFTAPPCEVKCRDPAVIAAVKQKINSQSAAGSVISNFKSILQSFASSTTSCEYFMTKDVTSKNTITNAFVTETNLDTYVTAKFTPNYENCSFALDAVAEFDPELITARTDRVTGETVAFMNGVPVELPFLYSYDNTTPSGKVNETVQILS